MNDNLSSLFENFNIDKNSITPEAINNLMSILNASSSNSDNEQASASSSSNSSNDNLTNDIDINTILKIKSIIEKIDIKNDPRSHLLESLKPYLKESRRSKIDQYVQLMNMSKIIDAFNLFSGDNSNASK